MSHLKGDPKILKGAQFGVKRRPALDGKNIKKKVLNFFLKMKKCRKNSNVFFFLEWSRSRVASGVQKINDYQFFSPHYRLIIEFLILYRLILSTFFIFRIFGPDIDPEPELNFHLKKLAHF